MGYRPTICTIIAHFAVKLAVSWHPSTITSLIIRFRPDKGYKYRVFFCFFVPFFEKLLFLLCQAAIRPRNQALFALSGSPLAEATSLFCFAR